MIFSAFKRVFARLNFIWLALAAAIAVVLISIWLPNKSLLGFVLSADNLSWTNKLVFLFRSFGILGSNFSIFSRSVLIILAVLTGINLAFLVYFLKNRVTEAKASGLGWLGMVSGLIGIGCASCGSVILSTIFGFTAVSGFLGLLPWQGTEFAVIGMALLSISIWLLGTKIINPLICPIRK